MQSIIRAFIQILLLFLAVIALHGTAIMGAV